MLILPLQGGVRGQHSLGMTWPVYSEFPMLLKRFMYTCVSTPAPHQTKELPTGEANISNNINNKKAATTNCLLGLLITLYCTLWASEVALVVKNLNPVQET